MIGTLVNAAAIIAGGVIGLSMKRELAQRHQLFLKTVLGVLALYTGFRMVWLSVGGSPGRMFLQVLLALAALIMGKLIGSALALQRRVNGLGRYARDRFTQARSSGQHDFSEGFIACTILFCVGPMAIVGALQEGIHHDPRTLLVKAAMDGLATLGFVRVFGPGTLLAALPVVAYQGSITLLAGLARPAMERPGMLEGLGAAGGLLVASTALLILDVKKVPLADYLPALVVAPFLRLLVP